MLISLKSHAAALEEVKSELGKHLRRLNKRIDSFENNSSERTTALAGEITALREHLEEMEERQQGVMRPLHQELERVHALGRKLERTINSFQVLRDKASKKLLEETKIEIAKQLRGLTASTGEYRRLATDLHSLSADLDATKVQLARWNAIANQLKESDFTLQRFSKEMEIREREIIRLARENERLKSLIGRERRRSRH